MKVIRETQGNLLYWKAKGINLKEEVRDEVLGQQDCDDSQHEAHRQLREKSVWRNQRSTRHRHEHPPEQYPRLEWIDLTRAEIGRQEDGENGPWRDHRRDREQAVRRVERKRQCGRSKEETRPCVAPLWYWRRVADSRRCEGNSYRQNEWGIHGEGWEIRIDGHKGEPWEESGEGCDGGPHNLPRGGGRQGQHQELKGLGNMFKNAHTQQNICWKCPVFQNNCKNDQCYFLLSFFTCYVLGYFPFQLYGYIVRIAMLTVPFDRAVFVPSLVQAAFPNNLQDNIFKTFC